jgi:hypothetical protein
VICTPILCSREISRDPTFLSMYPLKHTVSVNLALIIATGPEPYCVSSNVKPFESFLECSKPAVRKHLNDTIYVPILELSEQ